MASPLACIPMQISWLHLVCLQLATGGYQWQSQAAERHAPIPTPAAATPDLLYCRMISKEWSYQMRSLSSQDHPCRTKLVASDAIFTYLQSWPWWCLRECRSMCAVRAAEPGPRTKIARIQQRRTCRCAAANRRPTAGHSRWTKNDCQTNPA